MDRGDFDLCYSRLFNSYPQFAVFEKKEIIWQAFSRLPVKAISEFVNHVMLLQDPDVDIKEWIRIRTIHKINENRTNKMLREQSERYMKINYETLGIKFKEAGVDNLWDLIKKETGNKP